MRRKKKCPDVDRELLLSDLELLTNSCAPEQSARCALVIRVGSCSSSTLTSWSQLTKDSSAAVRAGALHVFDDAVNIQSIGDAEYRFQSVEDRLRKKREPLLRSDEAEAEVRRSGRFKKRKGSFVLR
jgi:hypothetical protein